VTVVLERATARGARRAVAVDFTLGAGVHAVVGGPDDGTRDLPHLIGGLASTATGRVLVDGRDPSRDPALRARIGVTLETPALPECASVRDLFEIVDSLRRSALGHGGGDAAGALSELGALHWNERRLSSLSLSEARALELILALTTPRPLALALTEPGLAAAELDREVLKTRIARAATEGASVILLTASVADALELGATLHMMERGRVVRSFGADDAGALTPGRGIELSVDVDLPRLLVAELAGDPAALGIRWDQMAHRSIVSVRGDDVDQVALAVARAAVASGAEIRSIAPIAPGVEEVRAATAGLAWAAYQAAHGVFAKYAARSSDASDTPTPTGASDDPAGGRSGEEPTP
jgi:ABC-2 type transport system ATP-binding protein